MQTKNIGFIGAGNMANSLIRGLIESGLAANNIWVADINPQAVHTLIDNLHVNGASDNLQLVEAVDVVVLAVKPQTLKEVAEQIAAQIATTKPLIVSIAAGINQTSLSKWLGESAAIVRCMPNTPALVLTGATALHANAQVDTAQRDLAENILRSVGLAVWVDDEAQLDVVTAISGSGPAYFFLLMEAMEAAALKLGLDQSQARLLILQTALGAAKIAMESSESPGTLRARVTSPGGTTQAAIQHFEQGGFSSLVTEALTAAYNRSITMSNELGAR